MITVWWKVLHWPVTYTREGVVVKNVPEYRKPYPGETDPENLICKDKTEVQEYLNMFDHTVDDFHIKDLVTNMHVDPTKF
jgi:hypothetical protein